MAATQPDPTVAIWGETLSSSTDILNPGNSYIQGGWPFVASPPKGPPRKFMNFIQKYAHNAVRWLMRRGVNDWSVSETYQTGDVARDPADNAIYVWAGGSPGTGGAAPASNQGSAKWQLVSRSTWSGFTLTTTPDKEIVAYRSAIGLRRGGFDRGGFRAGAVQEWDENWDTNNLGVVSSASTANFGDGWTVSALGSVGGACQRIDPSALNPSSHVQLYPATTGPSTIVLARTFDSTYYDASRHIVCRFDNFLTAGSTELANMELAFGLFQGMSFPFANSPFTTLAPVGVGFVKRPGDGVWQYYVKAQGGSPTITSTGFGAFANRTRVFMELMGANVSENGTSQVLLGLRGFGVTPATLAGFAPIGDAGMRPMFHSHRATSGSTAQGLVIGPVQFRANKNEPGGDTDQFP